MTNPFISEIVAEQSGHNLTPVFSVLLRCLISRLSYKCRLRARNGDLEFRSAANPSILEEWATRKPVLPARGSL
jgi:hypothetical protein